MRTGSPLPGCYCTERCMAPRIIGQQMGCRRGTPLLPGGRIPDTDLLLTDELPEGLTYKNGRLVFDCRVCGAESEFPADPADFDRHDPHLLCGGSPRCCP